MGEEVTEWIHLVTDERVTAVYVYPFSSAFNLT
jgi:hypothetical protein